MRQPGHEMESGGSACRNGQSSGLCPAHFIGAGVKNPSLRVLKMCTQVKELTPVLGVEGWGVGEGGGALARACRASVVRTVPY